MPRYIIRENQHVIACRLVEADDEESALEAFYDGEGQAFGKNGDVTDSQLLSIEGIDEAKSEPTT